ncbi:MAG: dockerin type I repeat-containing protein [Clostridia bacterium]|nr:dockerin type I repeat-containing protein [Clostridia bacterium]
MSKNFKSVICCVLTLLMVAGTIVFVFAGSNGTGVVESETASEVESEIVSDVAGEDTSEAESEVADDVALLGDVNRDGNVTAADARLALRFAAELQIPTAAEFALANVNGDERMTAADARDILRVSAELDPMFTTTVVL